MSKGTTIVQKFYISVYLNSILTELFILNFIENFENSKLIVLIELSFYMSIIILARRFGYKKMF